MKALEGKHQFLQSLANGKAPASSLKVYKKDGQFLVIRLEAAFYNKEIKAK